MLPVDVLLRWKRTFRILLPFLLAVDMVHSMYYVAGLYKKRREEWEEEDFAEVKEAVKGMLHGVVQHCQHKDPLLWPSVISHAFGSSSDSKPCIWKEHSVRRLDDGRLASDTSNSPSEYGASDIFYQLGMCSPEREDTASKANVDQADPDMERSCASQQQHSSSKDPAADTHLSWSRFQRFWDKLQWSRIASLQLPLSGRSHDDTAETAIAQSSRPAAARTEAATATDFATGANAHQSGYAWASSPAQLRLEQQFTKLVGTLQHSLGSAVDRLPKSAVVQGCPWPCMALTRRSALRWHVTWHGFTWPDVPQASLELQLDDCY